MFLLEIKIMLSTPLSYRSNRLFCVFAFYHIILFAPCLSHQTVSVIQSYPFPPDIVFNSTSFLTEIVVDVLNDRAIIADAGSVRQKHNAALFSNLFVVIRYCCSCDWWRE
jgi:hypothetical protein